VAIEVRVTASVSFRNLWTTMAQDVAQVWLEQVVSRMSVVFEENAYEVFKQMSPQRHKLRKSVNHVLG